MVDWKAKDILILTAITVVLMALGLTTFGFVLIAACIVLMPWKKSLIVTALPVICAVVLYHDKAYMLVECAALAVSCVIAAVLIKKKAANRLVLIILCLGMTAMLAGTFIADVNMGDEAFSTTSFMDELGIAADMDAADLEALGMASVTLTGMITGGMLFIMIRYAVTCIFMLKNKKAEKPSTVLPMKPMVPVPLWMLSKNFSVGLCVGIAAVIAVNAAELGIAQTASYVIATVFLFPLCVQGAAFLIFSATVRRRRMGGTVLLILLAAVFAPVSLVIMGLLDQIMRPRAKSIVRLPNDMQEAKQEGPNDSEANKDEENEDENNN